MSRGYRIARIAKGQPLMGLQINLVIERGTVNPSSDLTAASDPHFGNATASCHACGASKIVLAMCLSMLPMHATAGRKFGLPPTSHGRGAREYGELHCNDVLVLENNDCHPVTTDFVPVYLYNDHRFPAAKRRETLRHQSPSP
nr:hypothetical protein CFP56_10360 [Quercus suber]